MNSLGGKNNCRGRNTSKLILWDHHNPDTKTRQKQHAKRKPEANITDEHRCKNPQFSHSVVSDSLWPQGEQHSRLPCPSPIPIACSNSSPSSWWCHPTISSSAVPFSHLQSFPASGLFPMSQLFVSGGQSIGVSASTLVLPINTQDWSL